MILRGQTGTDLDGSCTAPGDAVAQAEQAMDNVAVLLDEAGASRWSRRRCSSPTARSCRGDDAVLRRLDGITPCFSALVVKGWPVGTADGSRYHRGDHTFLRFGSVSG
jgi:hypothetical protein